MHAGRMMMLEIRVNGQPLETQLEEEKTLNDVIRSVETWLLAQDLVITGLRVDGTHVDPADRLFLMQRPVSSAKIMEVTSASLADLEGESSIEIMRYLARLETALGNDDADIFGNDAREGIRWVCGSLRLLAGIHHLDLGIIPSPEKSILATIQNLEKHVTALDADPENATIMTAYKDILATSVKTLLVDAYDFLLLVNKRIDDDGNIPAQADHLARAFAEHVQEVSTISADLQTGNEARAMMRIQKTVVLIEELMRLFERAGRRYRIGMDSIKLGEESLQSWMGRMMETGNSIINAFHDRDTVLLGDLFEYEISQELEKVPGFLSAVKQSCGSGS